MIPADGQLPGLGVGGSAVFSDDGVYRYLLSRVWARPTPAVCWVMLNPSTADADLDDQTIRRCTYYSRRAGAGSLLVVNLYAYRATHPAELLTAPNPTGGRENWIAIDQAIGDSAMVVAAWGAGVNLRADGPDIEAAFRAVVTLSGLKLLCLGTTKDGHPRHPSRLGNDVPFEVLG